MQNLRGTGEQTVEDFLSQLAAGIPAPGGGTAAAVAGAMAAALVAMVANLTLGREKYAGVQAEMQRLVQTAVAALGASLEAADADQASFALVMQGYAMPKGSASEKAERAAAIQAGLQAATRAPVDTMRRALIAGQAAVVAAQKGNVNARTDAICAFLLARAAFEGALWNAAANLGGIKDATFRSESLETIAGLRRELAALEAIMAGVAPDPTGALLPQD